jgi:hypothetical protein
VHRWKDRRRTGPAGVTGEDPHPSRAEPRRPSRRHPAPHSCPTGSTGT